jgi:sugar (glycoside-pentoside-hexuronide) transporter
MTDSVERISIKEKVGYGLGDMAANFVFQTVLVFQLSFYTDTFGIAAAAAGTLFLVVRVGGAVCDPLMGILADRTTTKWGKFRPWAVPFGVIGLLAFTTPDLSPTGKLLYAYITYALLTIVYSANNVPYSALSAVITGDMNERTSLLSYRQVFANGAAFIVQGLAIPMLKYFGQGDNAKGQMTMGLFLILAVIFFCITFFTTKERIQPDPRQKTSLKQDLADLTKNGPWMALFALTVFVFIALSLRGGTMLFYFKYSVGQEDLFSLFNVFGLGSLIVGIFFSNALARRFGKRNVFIGGLLLAAVFTALLVVLPAGAVALIFAVEVLRQFAYGWTAPLLWAMVADVADYSEWRTGRRATAMVSAGIIFGLKAGLGFGGAIGGWLLSVYGYVPNVEQSAEALLGIRMIAGVFAAIAFFGAVVCLLLYKIDKQLNIRMTEELAERRRKYTS